MAKTPRAGGKVDDTIFVGVRLRPFLGYEGKQQCLTPSRNVISVRAPDKKKEYAFDCVMDSMDPSKPNHVSQEKLGFLLAGFWDLNLSGFLVGISRRSLNPKTLNPKP